MNRSLIFIFTFCLFAVLLLPNHAFAKKGAYIGNEACEKCHSEIFESWKKSLHSTSFALLAPGTRSKEKEEAGLKPDTDYTTDRSCLACHVIGLDKEGGYNSSAPVEKLKGIGCESCHGPAEKWLDIHDKEGLERKKRLLKRAGYIDIYKGKTVCARCHGNDKSPYKYRDEKNPRDYTDRAMAKSFHILP